MWRYAPLTSNGQRPPSEDIHVLVLRGGDFFIALLEPSHRHSALNQVIADLVPTASLPTPERLDNLERFKVAICAAIGILTLACVITVVTPKRVLAALGYTPVRDVDQPARAPYSGGFGFLVANGTTSTTSLGVVPAGKRLVIEYFSGSGEVPTGQTAYFYISTTAGGTGGSHSVPVTQKFADAAFAGSDALVAAQPLRLYADPGTNVEVGFRRSSANGGAFCSAFISGYYVTLP